MSSTDALGIDQTMDVMTQIMVGDADEAPGLHEADAGCVVRGCKYSAENFRRYRCWQKMSHVAPFFNDTVDGGNFGIGIAVLAHDWCSLDRNRRAAAAGLDAK